MTALLEKVREGTGSARKGLKDSLPGPVKPVIGIIGVLLVWAIASALMPKGIPAHVVLRGLVYGGLYALIAIGIILVYRANRVVNFAQAEFGSVAAVLTIEFAIHGMNYFLAVALGVLIAAFTGALVNVAII